MEKTIIPRADLQLRKVGSLYMIVDLCSGSVNLTNVFSLNETAAELWRHVTEGNFTVAELAEWLAGEYGIDRSVALRDVTRQLDEWREFGLVK